jgi:hypothetical protein
MILEYYIRGWGFRDYSSLNATISGCVIDTSIVLSMYSAGGNKPFVPSYYAWLAHKSTHRFVVCIGCDKLPFTTHFLATGDHIKLRNQLRIMIIKVCIRGEEGGGASKFAFCLTYHFTPRRHSVSEIHNTGGNLHVSSADVEHVV